MKTQLGFPKNSESTEDLCDQCGQALPDPKTRIPIILKQLKKETGFGEKCKSKQSKR